MPTVLVEGTYSFIFFSSDKGEPPHIHVKSDYKIAKFWIDPVALAKNKGFKKYELNDIEKLVISYQKILMEKWNDYFSS